jgi:transcriptional regulator with XRE-family HTH domain
MTNLEFIRRVNNMRQKEFSKLLGINQSYLCQLETRQRRNPGQDIRNRLQEILGKTWHFERLMEELRVPAGFPKLKTSDEKR